MSALSSCYAFVEHAQDRREWVWPSVVQEMTTVEGLLFLLEVDLAAPWASHVGMGDSSSTGYALLETTATYEEVKEAAKWRERWRFRKIPVLSAEPLLEPSFIEWAGGLSALGGNDEDKDLSSLRVSSHGADGPSTSYGKRIVEQIDTHSASQRHRKRAQQFDRASQFREVELQSYVPPIDQRWDKAGRYKVVLKGKWHWVEEHINLKEGRVTLMWVRRLCRSQFHCQRHHLYLGDNLASICAFEKGRAKSWRLNSLCRRMAAYALGGELRLHFRHLPSERNLADADSRGHSLRYLQLLQADDAPKRSEKITLCLEELLFGGETITLNKSSDGNSDLTQGRNVTILRLVDLVPPPGLGQTYVFDQASPLEPSYNEQSFVRHCGGGWGVVVGF